MGTGPRLKVSSDRLVKPGIKLPTPGLEGKRFIHYTTAAPHAIKDKTVKCQDYIDSEDQFPYQLGNKEDITNERSSESDCLSEKGNVRLINLYKQAPGAGILDQHFMLNLT